MPRAFITTLTFLLAVLLTDAAASAQDTPRHGRALLREFCGNCHAIGRSDRSRMPYAVPFRTLGRTFDLDRFPPAARTRYLVHPSRYAGIQVQQRQCSRSRRLSALDP